MLKSKAIVLLAKIILRPNQNFVDRRISGICPSFNYMDQLVACEITTVDGSEWIEVGEEQTVWVKLFYGEELGWDLPVGTTFLLNVGGLVVGEGKVLDS